MEKWLALGGPRAREFVVMTGLRVSVGFKSRRDASLDCMKLEHAMPQCKRNIHTHLLPMLQPHRSPTYQKLYTQNLVVGPTRAFNKLDLDLPACLLRACAGVGSGPQTRGRPVDM